MRVSPWDRRVHMGSVRAHCPSEIGVWTCQETEVQPSESLAGRAGFSGLSSARDAAWTLRGHGVAASLCVCRICWRAPSACSEVSTQGGETGTSCVCQAPH